MPSKPEIIGQRLLNFLLSQKADYGGAFCYITGAQGGGKTSAMFFMIEYTLQMFPNQKLFLSETYDAPLQCFKTKNLDKIRFYVKKGSKVVFRDRHKHLEQTHLKETYFDDFDDLWNKALPGYINVVFFGDRTEWMRFVEHLRHVGEWCHVYFDEIGEVIPSDTSGAMHKKIGQFSVFSKDIRKCMLKVITNTQSVRDMDWRVRDKFMFRIFLPGAMADKHCRVTQKAIDNLVGNEHHGNDAYISRFGDFGLITFTDIFKPNPKYSIEAHILQKPDYHSIDDSNDDDA